jgi:hypothetical protein
MCDADSRSSHLSSVRESKMTSNFYICFLFMVFIHEFPGCQSEELPSNPNRGMKENSGTFTSIQGLFR